ncbi:MAG: 3-deoxy-7-phosphoheptulonate synthase [Clostridiaceae bacterium]|nr:3-deoxy-7-phosphoheptulonate synthase [Clostridiaceae bacterium]
MSFNYLCRIPTTEEIIAQYPLSPELADLKAERDQQIRKVLTGESDRFLVIIGPCSADHEDSVCEYTARLGRLQEEVADRLILIPRIYTNKPRTTGQGYKGILHQPDPEKAPDLVGGLIALRKMHIRSLSESGLTAADEMLYPENHTYLADMLSYVAIGARSVENQQHRLTVSGIEQPAGMKNPTSGDLNVMLNAIFAAQHAHTFSYQGWEVRTSGNPLAHAILRGAVNKFGQSQPNYHYEDLKLLIQFYQKRELSNPACLIDTNHANSDKQFAEQPRIVQEVLHSRRLSPDIRQMVKGFMIESYLEEGNQAVGEHVYGRSITDACLGWPASRDLVLSIADQV